MHFWLFSLFSINPKVIDVGKELQPLLWQGNNKALLFKPKLTIFCQKYWLMIDTFAVFSFMQTLYVYLHVYLITANLLHKVFISLTHSVFILWKQMQMFQWVNKQAAVNVRVWVCRALVEVWRRQKKEMKMKTEANVCGTRTAHFILFHPGPDSLLPSFADFLWTPRQKQRSTLRPHKCHGPALTLDRINQEKSRLILPSWLPWPLFRRTDTAEATAISSSSINCEDVNKERTNNALVFQKQTWPFSPGC